MDLGGPVWHASAAFNPQLTHPPAGEELVRAAQHALAGVGDVRLGEWREWGQLAYHIRRRVSAKEERMIGPAVDIRADRAEVERRLAVVRRWLPEGWTE